MNPEESPSLLLVIAPLLIYALLRENPGKIGPRGQWRLLQSLDSGLVSCDPFGAALVDTLNSNLHKFNAHFCRQYGQATAGELLTTLAAVRLALDDGARAGIDPRGVLNTLARFADTLGSDAGSTGYFPMVRSLLN